MVDWVNDVIKSGKLKYECVLKELNLGNKFFMLEICVCKISQIFHVLEDVLENVLEMF